MANPNIVATSVIRGQSAIRKFVLTSTISLLENAADSNEVLKVNSISIFNTDTLEHDITVQLVRDGVAYKLLSTVRVPADSTLVAINKDLGLYLLEGDTLEAFASASNRLNIVCSYEQIAESEVPDRQDLENVELIVDEFANSVVLLINANGSNGAQNNTFVDSSSNNFTVTRTGDATQGSFSPFSAESGKWSNYFDGNGDHFAVANNAALNMDTSSFTIDAWIYLTATPVAATPYGAVIIDKDALINVSWPQYAISINPNRNIVFQASAVPTSTVNATITSSNTIQLNTWYHVAVTRNGSAATLWINGVSNGTTNSVPLNLTTGSRPLLIGWADRGTADSTFNFPGYISNLRIVKGTVLYTTAFTPPTEPLTAVTNTVLLTCQDNRFVDNSSNNFAIARTGNVQVSPFSPLLPSVGYSPSTSGAGYFDGTGDFLSVTANPAWAFGTGDFTVETWAYFESGSNLGRITNRNPTTGATGTWGFNISPTSFSFTEVVAGEPGVTASGLPVMTTTWTHLAACRSGSTLRLFANGVQVGSDTNTTNFSNTTYPLTVATVPEVQMKGYLSGTRIVKGTALYTTNFTPPTVPLTPITNTQLLLNFANAGVVDASGKNNIATIGNAQVSTAVTKYGSGSLAFDGTGDYLTITSNNSLEFGSGNFTIECWFYANSLANNPMIVDFRPSGTQGNYVTLSVRSTGSVQLESNQSVRINGGSVPISIWTHIALSKSGTSTRAFVNGTQVGSTYTDSTSYIVGANRPSIAADGATLGDNTLNGYIDDLRITKGVARYTANFTPPEQLAFP